MRFKVGDRIRCTESQNKRWLTVGKEYVVVDMNTSGSPTVHADDGGLVDTYYGEFHLISEAKMSKYEELKARIEGLKNGWDKEADDILRELHTGSQSAIQLGIVHAGRNAGAGDVRIYDTSGDLFRPDASFSYSSQCSKMTAFKQALLWLLDHSDIKKDEKSEKIEELKKRMEEISAEIKELEK